MDRADRYRAIVKRIFQEVAAMIPSTEELRIELACDDTIGHYQLGEVGWKGEKRIEDTILHADVLTGKVWIQNDSTDLTLADLLEREGIPKQDIVLAFHPPDLRVYTDYAVA